MRHLVPLIAAILLSAAAAADQAADDSGQQHGSFEIAARDTWTQGGTCYLRYALRYRGDEPLRLRPLELSVAYRGWLANASCPAHVAPVLVQGRVECRSQSSAAIVVRDARRERDRCRERVTVRVGRAVDELSDPARDPGRVDVLQDGEQAIVELAFRHEHFLYGPHDPLLGEREVEIRWGALRVEDRVRLGAGHRVDRPRRLYLEPSRARQDPEYCYSPPGALYLAADVPGYQYYRFDDVPVRYGSEWLLRFRYSIARGTQATCRVRVVEYQESPRYWRRLGGGFDEKLNRRGEWTLFERRFRVGDETTAIAVDFRMTGSDVGEMWVDDVELVPARSEATSP